MMSDNDMSLNRESLNQVLAYINHTEVCLDCSGSFLE